MRGTLSVAALAAAVATASGAIIPLSELNQIRTSASATTSIQAVEKEAVPATETRTPPPWFQALLSGSVTISSSASSISKPAPNTPVAVSSRTSTSSVPVGGTVTSDLTVTPVPTPSYVRLVHYRSAFTDFQSHSQDKQPGICACVQVMCRSCKQITRGLLAR